MIRIANGEGFCVCLHVYSLEDEDFLAVSCSAQLKLVWIQLWLLFTWTDGKMTSDRMRSGVADG